MDDSYRIKNKSIEKAVKVLNCFTQKSQWGVTEISDSLGLNKSNVHDILTTLSSLNYVQKNDDGKYRLGIGIFSLSRALGDNFSVKKIALPYLQELSNITQERVYLGVGYRDEVLYLEAFYPTDSINLMRSLLGVRAKMYPTAIGKALLAYLPKDTIHQYIQRDLYPFTEYTITDPDLLWEELIKIKNQGYAIDNMEHEFGIKCVAAPIFDEKKQAIAAISISGPSLRFDDAKMPELIDLVKEYAKKIERRMV